MNTTTPTPTTTRRQSLARRAGFVLLAGGAIVGVAACSEEEGSGDLATVTIDDLVDPEITGLPVLDDIDVRVQVDPTASQRVTARIDDNLLDDGALDMDDDGVLVVNFDDVGGFVDIQPSQRPLVTLRVHSLDHVENRGDGVVTVTGVDESRLDVETHGDGAVEVRGVVDKVELVATGDTGVDLGGLVARHVVLDTDTDGPVRVHATERVTGDVRGDRDIEVYGGGSTTAVDVHDDAELAAF